MIARFPRKQVIAKIKGRFHIAFDIEIAANIGFPQAQFAACNKQSAERGGMVQDQGESRIVFHAPEGAVPESDPKV